ncbi:MAG: hypothetical protein AAF694_31120 [Bacteroidota bacterium]
MKSVKILSFFLALVVVGFHTAIAQDSEVTLTAEQKEQMKQNFEEFAAVLNLSDEQKADFEAITKKYTGKMIAVKEGGGSKLKKYKKVKAIRADRNAEMEELLSPDQYQIYLDKQAEFQEKMKAKRNQM